MSASNDFEAELLDLIFNNSNIANIGDATGLRGATAAGSFYVALFTADPGEADSASNEASYTGYARVAVARSAGGWTRSGTAPTQVANTSAVTFGQCTAGSNTITHAAICKAGTAGVADILLSGALSSSLAVSTNITPQFNASQLVFTLD